MEFVTGGETTALPGKLDDTFKEELNENARIIRDRLIQFYGIHNPEKVKDASGIAVKLDKGGIEARKKFHKELKERYNASIFADKSFWQSGLVVLGKVFLILVTILIAGFLLRWLHWFLVTFVEFFICLVDFKCKIF